MDGLLDSLAQVAIEMRVPMELSTIEGLRESYAYMKRFFREGVADENRAEMYDELLRKTYRVWQRLNHSAELLTNRSLRGAQSLLPLDDIEQRLFEFETLMTLDGLDIDDLNAVAQTPGKARTVAHSNALFAYRDQMFTSLYGCCLLTAEEEESLRQLLLSPMTDLADARLVISALLLAQQHTFDLRRLRVLASTYLEAESPTVSMLALVALVLTQHADIEDDLYADEVDKVYDRLSESDTIHADLITLQQLILATLDAKQTATTIREDILPAFKEQAERLAREEGEGLDPIEEILNASAAEDLEERVEQSMERMRALQTSGADVYYDGFAQAKRFPFFYRLANWFMLFDAEHPALRKNRKEHNSEQVSTAQESDEPAVPPVTDEMIQTIMRAQNFCETDKYSFYITFSAVADQLPNAIRKALANHDVSMFGGELGESPLSEAEGAVALYLQDLFRFYTLSPYTKDFKNAFEGIDDKLFRMWEAVYNDAAANMVHRVCYEDEDNVAYHEVLALIYAQQGKLTAADAKYELIQDEHPIKNNLNRVKLVWLFFVCIGRDGCC